MTDQNAANGPDKAGGEATCPHQRGHIVDSRFFGGRYSSAASRRIFCDECRVQRWLSVEAALALAQADLGIIPVRAARDIAAAARAELIDFGAVEAETERTGHSLVGLLRVFQAACAADSGQYVHFGATTQDIQDTAQALEMRDVLDMLDETLRGTARHLARLADEHAGTVALGRTHAQPALPITFGLKIAGWLDEILRHLERLAQARQRVLVAELFGGAGTMAAFGPRALELLDGFAARLGLGAPVTGWHVARDRVAEFVTTVAMAAGTLGRAADEIRILSRPEFGEVSEAWSYGKVGSSTMPHKRNPERCEQIVVLARLAAAQAPVALTAMIGDHERDSRSLRLEWACVADVSHYALGAAEIFAETARGLQVHPERLKANTYAVAEQVASEPLMMALAVRHGKQSAHDIVYGLTQRAVQAGMSLRELIEQDTDGDLGLDSGALAAILRPESYIGAARDLVGRVTARAGLLLDGDGQGAREGQSADQQSHQVPEAV
ncbi:MAG TPA: adenylosuccinate lyase family protein [Streptosporangiaceae bacterium]|nr:adenylosuccinate lyase family protein [Streptosporangiaceae bacterium]